MKSVELWIVPESTAPGGAILLEHSRNEYAIFLPPSEKRHFYRLGDVVLLKSVAPAQFLMEFPEFSELFPEDELFGILAKAFGPEIIVGRIIKGFTLDPRKGLGYGWVELEPVFFIEKTACSMGRRTKSRDTNVLADDFDLLERMLSLKVVKIAGEAAAETVLLALSAGGGAAAKKVVTKLVKSQVQKQIRKNGARFAIMRVLMKLMRSKAPEIAKEFVTKFITVFLKNVYVEGIQAKYKKDTPKWDKAIKLAIAEASASAVVKSLSIFDAYLSDRIKKGLTKGDESMKAIDLRKDIKQYLTEAFVRACTTGPLRFIVDVAVKQVESVVESEPENVFEGLDEQVRIEMKNRLEEFAGSLQPSF